MADKPFKMFSPKGRDLGASMPGAKMPAMSDDAVDMSSGGKMPSDQAGYMELDGAVKDADCSKVQVDGGVSSDLGCCNEYNPQEGSQEFRCGTCTFLLPSSDMGNDDSGQQGGRGIYGSESDAGVNTGANQGSLNS